jgi:DNA adenine methylase
MKYMGSKARFTKDILPIILKDRRPEQWYVEPFAGGMNVITNVSGNRVAIDNNEYLIEMWKYLWKEKRVPLQATEITRELYDAARDMFYGREDKTLSDFLIGYIGYMGSANGRFFDGGWSGISKTKNGKERNYIEESVRNIKKHLSQVEGDVKFIFGSYYAFDYPKNSLIYCDPPYQNTKQYGTSKNFDYEHFWHWVREMSKEGHTVFVSEYNAPADFECVWQKEAKSSLSANGEIGGNKLSVEKLFKFSPTNVQ